MAMTNTSLLCRLAVTVCLLCGTTSFLRADDGQATTTETGQRTWRNVYPSDVRSPIQRTYPSDPGDMIDSASDANVVQVAHPAPVQCLRCVDRKSAAEGMIGGVGRELGIGPCIPESHQCWQCPYDPPFNLYNQGEYAGPARIFRIPEYRLRTGDTILLTFLLTELKSEGSYRLVVGDELRIVIEAEDNEEIAAFGELQKDRGIRIQPDGTITLPYIGQVHVAGQTIAQLRNVLEQRMAEYYRDPVMIVLPVSTGTAARDVRDAITGQQGFNPQEALQTITPSGEIRLPRIGSVQAQGLTLEELKQEINLRYDQIVGGLEVEPSLESQVDHNFFVLGEVNQPGRFNMENTPTTVLSAMAMAGGHIPGANLRQVVIFRRGENWELLSTTLDLRGAILGRVAHPADEIWIRDGDVIIVPAAPIRLFNNFVRQVFTDGIYGVVPFGINYDFTEIVD